jgi:hypothetical protein
VCDAQHQGQNGEDGEDGTADENREVRKATHAPRVQLVGDAPCRATFATTNALTDASREERQSRSGLVRAASAPF